MGILNETVPAGVNATFYGETQGPAIYGLGSFFIAFAVCVVALRFYARKVARVGYWWDDWFALATVPCIVGITASEMWSVQYGDGRHVIVIMNTDPTLLTFWFKHLFIEFFFYNTALATFKCCALALCYRIFAVQQWPRVFCIGMGSVILAWCVATNLTALFRCTPIWGQWEPGAATCILGLQQINVMLNIPTLAFDIVTLAFPIGLVWRLNLRPMQRVGFMCLFALGGLDIIISIIRLVNVLADPGTDPTWGNIPMFFWSVAEPLSGLLCCCLPTYIPVFRTLRDRGYRGNGSFPKDQTSHPPLREHDGAKRSYPRSTPRYPGSSEDPPPRNARPSAAHDGGSDTLNLTRLDGPEQDQDPERASERSI